MTPELVMRIGQDALTTMLVLAMPMLLVALAIGLLVGVFQAATQINEMTLSFIPKLIGMSVAIAVAGPWMLKVIVNYTQALIINIPAMIR
ncbi:MAG: flagellar biosynthetic protein FliQ [Gammaproteobacteria bacterium]|nr:flagellar biosynthetic protein FliQ [Gammaproteobacteria bacterium]